jgi:hypothetical protein
MGWFTCTRYLQLEKEKIADGATPETLGFALHQYNAYTPVIVILLKGINDFSLCQFSTNAEWIVPLLSQLVLCNEQKIRFFVSSIYSKHIDHVVLSALSK